MPKTLDIRRLIRKLLVTAVCLVALTWVVLIIIGRVLNNKGIAYDRLAFRFPSTATVEGLRIQNDALSLHAGTVHAQWSWGALLKGNIRGKLVIVRDAAILIKPDSSASETASSVPFIDIQRASLVNVSIKWANESDSSSLMLKEVEAVQLRYDGAITIDSLVNKGSRFAGNYSIRQPDHSPDSARAKRTLSIRTIPGFNVKFLSFNDCGFAIQYGDKHYAIDKFNLDFSGLNNHDILNMSLERLSFRYQDSLDVDLALNGANVDAHNDVHFKNLLLELPGLRVDMPELTMGVQEGLALAAALDSSYVNTDLLTFIFPTLKTWLPANTRVGLDGGLAYRGGRLTLDYTTLALGHDARILGTGFISFGNKADSLGLKIHDLHASLYTISKWSKIGVPDGQSNLSVRGEFQVSGTFSKIHTAGTIEIQGTQLHYKGELDRQRDGMAVTLSLKSPLVRPKEIVSRFEKDFRIAGLSLAVTAFVSNAGNNTLQFQFNSDSLFVGEQWIESPRITGDYAHTHSVVSVTSHEGRYSTHVNVKGNVLSGDNIFCSGNVALKIPDAGDTRLANGSLYATFQGDVAPRTPAVDLKFDSLLFKPVNHRAYTAKGQLTAAQLPDKSFKAFLSVGDYATINAVVGEDVTEWLKSDDKLTLFPTAKLSMSVHVDTTLVRAIAGIPAYVEIDELNIVSRTHEINVNFSSDTLSWKQFHTHRVVGTVNYHPGSLTGKIETPELITPYALFDSVRFEIAKQRDSLFTVSLDTYLPEIDRPLGLSYRIASMRDSIRIAFADSTLLLGASHWRTDQSGALTVSRAFDAFAGSLQITNKGQTATLLGDGHELVWTLDSLDLFPITQTIAAEPPIHGIVNASVHSNFAEGEYRWEGALAGASVDTIQFGDLGIRGFITPNITSVTGELQNDEYKITGKLEKARDEESRFDIKMMDVDLAKFSSLLPVPAHTLTVAGILNANIQGTYGKNLRMKGFMSLPNTEVISSEYDVYLKSDMDSLILNGTTVNLNDFVFRDRRGNPITLDGSLQLAESVIDLSIRTNRLRLLDRTQKKSTLTGEVDVACDLRVKGRNGNYKVSGNLATLSGASVTYLYKTTITLDDREREMEFVSFTQPENVKKVRSRKRSLRKPIEWDVTVDVGAIDVTVLFSAVNQDRINTTAKGKVSFTTGTSAEPSAYGIIESNSGTVAYHVPMISDLRMTIAKAGVRWVGDAFKPLLSFNGTQIFRITPNEISSLWTNKTDKWPISVIAKVNDRPFNDLVLDFDLSSSNNQVSDWISSLPPDTREAYAVSLLIRGRINTGGTADVNLLTQAMVSKMNEISSRNIKSADVSFYDESRGPNSTEGSSSKIGYSISKGIINKKVRIVVGGSVDLTSQADPSMPDVKIEYVLSEDPTTTLRAGKANVYTGVIDGNVDESSLGITYIKRFRNLFSARKNATKE